MMPGAQSPNGPPRVTLLNPSYETSGMLALRLDMQGNLLFLRGVPPQVETGEWSRDPNWGLLFAEAGLDKTQFVPASPKWVEVRMLAILSHSSQCCLQLFDITG
jgi:hypothetical protein